MKVTGEAFSLIEKEPKRQDATNIKTFRQKNCYRTELWRALYKKAPKGQFLIIRKFLTEFAFKKSYFLIYYRYRKNLSGKRTE